MLGRASEALGLALLTVAVAGAVVLVSRTLEERAARATYLEQVAVLCESYGQELDLIAPPDISVPASVYDAVSRALPVLEAELADVRAIPPPRSLRRTVSRFLTLTDGAIDELRRLRAEALYRDLWSAYSALGRFEAKRDRAQRAGRDVGFAC